MTEAEIRSVYGPKIAAAREAYERAEHQFRVTPSAYNFRQLEGAAIKYQEAWSNQGEALAAKHAWDAAQERINNERPERRTRC